MKKFLYAWGLFALVVWAVALFASPAVCRIFLAVLGASFSATCLWLIINQPTKS